MGGESEERLLARLARGGHRLIGDDAALVGGMAVTADHQVPGVHTPSDLDPRWLGRRLVRVNLSDLAAVGAKPHLAFLAVASPPRFDRRRLLDGVADECRRWGLTLAGGDLSRAERPVLSMTLIGRRRRRGRFVRRAGGRPGDRLWLGAAVGASAAGRWLLSRGARLDGRRVALPASLEARGRRTAAAARRAVRGHLLPEPQLELGAWLARRRRAAAIDVSDGLARDLHRLCRASGAGAELAAADLPLAAGLTELAGWLGREPRELALAGGEDYVLLFALPPGVEPDGDFGCREIGRLRRRAGVDWVSTAGRQRLAPAGWDHFGGASRATRRS